MRPSRWTNGLTRIRHDLKMRPLTEHSVAFAVDCVMLALVMRAVLNTHLVKKVALEDLHAKRCEACHSPKPKT